MQGDESANSSRAHSAKFADSRRFRSRIAPPDVLARVSPPSWEAERQSRELAEQTSRRSCALASRRANRNRPSACLPPQLAGALKPLSASPRAAALVSKPEAEQIRDLFVFVAVVKRRDERRPSLEARATTREGCQQPAERRADRYQQSQQVSDAETKRPDSQVSLLESSRLPPTASLLVTRLQSSPLRALKLLRRAAPRLTGAIWRRVSQRRASKLAVEADFATQSSLSRCNYRATLLRLPVACRPSGHLRTRRWRPPRAAKQAKPSIGSEGRDQKSQTNGNDEPIDCFTEEFPLAGAARRPRRGEPRLGGRRAEDSGQARQSRERRS